VYLVKYLEMLVEKDELEYIPNNWRDRPTFFFGLATGLVGTRLKLWLKVRVAAWPRPRLTARVNPTLHDAMLRIEHAGDGGPSRVGLTLAVNLLVAGAGLPVFNLSAFYCLGCMS